MNGFVAVDAKRGKKRRAARWSGLTARYTERANSEQALRILACDPVYGPREP
jgi:hypothetical protein